jgi:ABC-type transporter Mla MlaB component
MLRITPTVTESECLLKLEGCLAGDWVPELGACWCQTAMAAPDRRMRIDLTDVCFVDAAGRALMTLMYRAGVRFVTRGVVMPELVQQIAQAVDGGPGR